MGALAGTLVAGAKGQDSATWTPDGMEMLRQAEHFLAGGPTPIDLSPVHAVGVALGLASGGAPLLVDATTVSLIDSVRDGLVSTGHPTPDDPILAKAAELARCGSFGEAVAGAGGDEELSMLVGLFVGLDGGIGALPARLVSAGSAPGGGRGRRYLCGLTNRLLGVEKPNWYDPRNRRGPKEVLPGLWLSNLYGISRFTADHPNGLVLSLCNEEGRLDGHPHHVTFHIEDTPKTDANPSIEIVVDEVLAEITQARRTGQPVLVHCRHGASRTGLILRLVLLGELDASADDILTEALCLWPHTSTWNTDWMTLVERRAEQRTG